MNIPYFDLSTILENKLFLVIFFFFSFTLIIQLVYYFAIYRKLAFYKPPKYTDKQPPISVIICARHEELNLKKNLVSVLEQDYPNFEVIVVDDCSFDNTADYLKELKSNYSHLIVVENNVNIDDRFARGKKFPLTLGLKRAKYDTVVLTDADCQPLSKNWLSNIMRNYKDGVEIVIGYSPYFRKKGLLNLFIRLDTFFVALKYFSFSLSQKTYMGVGRNLSYKKELFFKNKGFATHYHIESGDDDLFIKEVATRKNVRIEISKPSKVLSEPRTTFKGWTRQKLRHLSAGALYHSHIKFLLGLQPITEFFFYLTFFLLVFQIEYSLIVGSIFLLRYAISLFFLIRVRNKLSEKKLWLTFFPFFELFFQLFYIYVISLRLFSKSKSWN